MAFFLGPYVQVQITQGLERALNPKEVKIRVCSPLESAILLIASETEVFSANRYPFLNKIDLVLHNATGVPQLGNKILVHPINANNNDVLNLKIQTDNAVDSRDYSVVRREDGAFVISAKTVAENQLVLLELITLWPTAFLVEFSGASTSSREVFLPGHCDLSGMPKRVVQLSEFYNADFEATETVDAMKIDAVSSVSFQDWRVVLDYNCGNGKEQQVVPQASRVSYCNIRVNEPR